MTSLFRALALPLLVFSLLPACSCSGGDDTTGSSGGGGPGVGGGGGSAPVYSNVVVAPATVSLDVPLGGTTTQDFTATADVDGKNQDVTAACAWSVDAAHGSMSGATLTAIPLGGKAQVTATCGSETGSADVTIRVVGDILATPETPTDAPDLFDMAAQGTDPSRLPVIEYPIDGAVSPRNLPSVEVQWTAAGSDLFRVTLASTFVSVNVYTTSLEALLSASDWLAVADTTAGSTLTFIVDGMTEADPSTRFTSTPVAFRVSLDTIDKSAIYWWASNQGQIVSQTFGKTDAPTPVKADCTSCHSLSRSGSRIGYSRCVGGDCGQLYVGFMHYDKATDQWVDTVDANAKAISGSYSTFSPVGNQFPDDSQSLAIVTRAGGSLDLLDPDSGAVVPSNVAAASTDTGTKGALMPDWSPDGAHVIFTTTAGPGPWIDLDGGSISRMSYAFDGTSHVFGTRETLFSGPVSLASGTYSNFFFPSYSSDGALIVMNGARSSWRNFSTAAAAGQRLFLSDKDGSYITDLEKMNGPGDLDITWPHWAPGTTPEYYWVVFASERDYGHELTQANTSPGCVANGVKQCKQLWIGAIDRSKVTGAPTEDPSAAPVWLPGQDLAADNISPYWTIPTSEIPQ
ncbi:MAG TPA: hypothetical protein VL400_04235 [Polyangiaceae bacterium]|nr:hypothetical protein [Polyangiaceae bacterium]